MFVLHCLVDIYRYHNKRVFCAFADYKKAFDLIDRSSLWLKLIATGVRGKILKLPSKLIRILHNITFCYKQLCGRCSVHMTPVVKVVTHCVFALL